MSAIIPDSHLDLLTGPILAILTTLMPDNQPQSSVVWIDYDGTHILVNTAKGRQKERNMAERPKVSLVAIDTNKPFHWIEVRGEVEELTEMGAVELMNRLTEIYTGSSSARVPTETRITAKIKPTRVIAYTA